VIVVKRIELTYRRVMFDQINLGNWQETLKLMLFFFKLSKSNIKHIFEGAKKISLM